MILCPKCNTNNDIGSDYCGNCGAKLHDNSRNDNPVQISPNSTGTHTVLTEPISPQPPRRNRPRWQVLTLLVLLVLILGSVGFVIRTMTNNLAMRSTPTPTRVTATTHLMTTANVTTTTQTIASFQEKVAVPSYFDPGSPGWTQMEKDSSTSSLASINPNSGPGASQDPNYADQVTQAIKAGILVVGYISTSYAGTQDHTRTLAAAKQDVDSYYRWYPNIEGIFVDEVSTDCGKAYSSYYQPLYDYIKHKGGVAKVILDPGTNTPECYMSAGDIIVNFDDTYANYVNWFPDPWVSKYSASRFWQVIVGTSKANMPQAVALSKQRNAGWVYITDEAGANPFAALPSYWSNELLLVSHA